MLFCSSDFSRQERILELVAISFCRGSSWPRDWTHTSCIAGRFFTTEPPGKPSIMLAVGFLYVFLCMLSFLFFLSIFLILNFVECAYSTSTDQFSSVTQSCPTLCIPMDCSMPGLPVCNQLPEFTQTHVHLVGDAIQASHPLSSLQLPPSVFPSIRVFFQWVSFLHQVAKVLEFQFQHQSFQRIFSTDYL